MKPPSLGSFCWLFGMTLLVGGTRSNEAPAAPTSGDDTVAAKSTVTLELVGRLPRKPGGSVGHMTVLGKHVYVVSDVAGLQVVDVSNPAVPRVAGSYQPKEELGPVAVSGEHAFVVESDTLLRVLDVSDPAHPRSVGSCKFPDRICGLDAAVGHVYVTTSDALRVVDVSDPAQPTIVGTSNGLELAGRVTVAGHFAYVATNLDGMRIFDISHPAKPTEIGAFEGPGNVTKVAVRDRYAYLADYSGGLYIVDISNPKKPRQLGRHGDFVVGDVAVGGKYAFLAAGGLDVIDVSQPDHPREVGGFSQQNDDTAWSVAVGGDHVFSISDAGLFVFRLNPSAAAR